MGPERDLGNARCVVPLNFEKNFSFKFYSFHPEQVTGLELRECVMVGIQAWDFINVGNIEIVSFGNSLRSHIRGFDFMETFFFLSLRLGFGVFQQH